MSLSLQFRVRAIYSFSATNPDELSFDKGDILDVVQRVGDDWFKATMFGKTGFIPANRVQRIHNEEEAPPTPPPRKRGDTSVTTTTKPSFAGGLRGASSGQVTVQQPFVSGARREFRSNTTFQESGSGKFRQSPALLQVPSSNGMDTRGRAQTDFDVTFMRPRGNSAARQFKEKVKGRLNRFLQNRPSEEDLVSKNIIEGEQGSSSTSSSTAISSSGASSSTSSNKGSNEEEQEESRTFKLPALNLRPFVSDDNSKQGKSKFLERFFKTRSQRIELEELNILQEFSPIFGVTLQEIQERQGDDKIPHFVTNAIQKLDQLLDVEGIFRIPGDGGEIQRIKMELNQNNELSMDNYEVHEVAALLKMFFRELRDPLLTLEL